MLDGLSNGEWLDTHKFCDGLPCLGCFVVPFSRDYHFHLQTFLSLALGEMVDCYVNADDLQTISLMNRDASEVLLCVSETSPCSMSGTYCKVKGPRGHRK